MTLPFLLISLYGLFSFVLFLYALQQCRQKKNSFGHVFKICNLYGSFVWADHLVFGLFWMFICLLTVLLHDWLLFLLTVSVFWLVRSIGETLYWFLQQFAPRRGNEPQQYWISRIVQKDAAWFMHQIFWQCITVLTIISTLYLSFLWLIHMT